MRAAPHLALGALAACAVAGCIDDSVLQGSLSEIFPLTVSNESVMRNNEAFQVTYLANEPAGVDVVAQLQVSLSGVAFLPGANVQLGGEYAPGHPRCTVIHHADGEAERALAPVAKGTLSLGAGGQPGQGTSGSFSLAFVNDGVSYGSGRTLLGTFNGIAVDAGF